DVKVIFSKDGEEFSTKDYTVEKGDTLTYNYPEIEGYDPPDGKYSETTGPINVDTTIIRDYSKKQYSVIVHYVDEDGNTLAPDYECQVEYMGDIQIDNPKIKGYKTDADGISICDVIENMDVNFVYTKIKDKDSDKDKDKDKDKNPETGDNVPLMQLAALLMASAGGAGFLAIRRRKEESGK
ncbi:MAG: MucBP domain-containing protein, partial [Clostridiales bacterium]|nr:MucBP domain-containing protein [Candidatus Crickella merdequi]